MCKWMRQCLSGVGVREEPIGNLQFYNVYKYVILQQMMFQILTKIVKLDLNSGQVPQADT